MERVLGHLHGSGLPVLAGRAGAGRLLALLPAPCLLAACSLPQRAVTPSAAKCALSWRELRGEEAAFEAGFGLSAKERARTLCSWAPLSACPGHIIPESLKSMESPGQDCKTCGTGGAGGGREAVPALAGGLGQRLEELRLPPAQPSETQNKGSRRQMRSSRVLCKVALRGKGAQRWLRAAAHMV